MKKKVKVSIIVASSVVAAIIAAVLIMSFVNVAPMDYFKGYERVAVLTSSQYEKPETAENKLALKKALGKTKFSVMHAVLEGKFDYAPNVIKDGEGEIAYLSVSEIKNLAPTASTQMLKFYYGKTKTIKLGGVIVKYDRMIVEYAYGDGEIINVTCTPYLEANIDNNLLEDEADENGFIGSIYYKVPQFKLRMNTSALFDAVKDL
ncbi:MAG: hypothetical protein IJD07_03855 [Clostridia bacterium]|nr:hypothetical protein [Clostridia bacterium]